MAAGVSVLGPYPPTQFDKAGDVYSSSGTSKSLETRMSEDVDNLGTASNVVSVEPIVVLGNVYLIVYMKA